MNPAGLVVLAACAAPAVWLLRNRTGVAHGVGVTALALALLAALLERPGASVTMGGVSLVVTSYSRLTLVVAASAFLLLAVLELAGMVRPAEDDPSTGSRGEADDPPGERVGRAGRAAGEGPIAGPLGRAPEGRPWMPVPLPAALLLTLAFLGAALPAADPTAYRYLPNAAGPEAGLLLFTAAGLLALPAGLRQGEDLVSLRTALREFRLIAVSGGLAMAGAAWLALLGSHAIPDPQASSAGLALVAAALALRLGIMPVHVTRARLGAMIPGAVLVVVAVWLPAAFALAVLAWSRAALTPLGLAAPGGAWVALVAIAFVTLAAGPLVAALQADLRHLVIYSIIGDGGMVLLAFAAGTSASAPAGRAWILLYATGKTALVGWAVAVRRIHGSGVLADLHGWARRAPVLALALVVGAVASVGLPGWGMFEVRQQLVQHALDGAWPWTPVLAGAAWLGLLPYLRLAWVGVREPAPTVRSGGGEWPALRHRVAPAEPDAGASAVRARLSTAVRLAFLSAPTLTAFAALGLALLSLVLGAGAAPLSAASGTD